MASGKTGRILAVLMPTALLAVALVLLHAQVAKYKRYKNLYRTERDAHIATREDLAGLQARSESTRERVREMRAGIATDRQSIERLEDQSRLLGRLDAALLERLRAELRARGFLCGDEWSPRINGLLFCTGLSVPEASMFAPNLEKRDFVPFLNHRGAAFVGPYGAMHLKCGALIAERFAPYLTRELLNTGSLGLQLAVNGASAGTAGDADIVCLSAGGDQVNFALSQRGDALVLALRTAGPEAEAAPRTIELCSLEPGARHHVAVSYTNGDLRCYRDGILTGRWSDVTGDFANWSTNGQLVIGSSFEGHRDWDGVLEHLAIYNRALSEDDVLADFVTTCLRLREQEPPQTVTVRAKLLEMSPTPDPRQIFPYRRSLSACLYEVQRVLKGTYGRDTICVYHWTLIDGETLPFRKIPPGVECELTVDRLARYERLQAEHSVDSTSAVAQDLDPYFDFTGASLDLRSTLEIAGVTPKREQDERFRAEAVKDIKPDPDVARRIRELTGARTRIAWSRAVDERFAMFDSEWSSIPNGPFFALIGLDTEEGEERVILPGPISCFNPLITWDGSHVIYSDWPNRQVCMVTWEGTDKRVLYEGQKHAVGLGYWRDPAAGDEWVYVVETDGADESNEGVYRVKVGDPERRRELAWNKTPVSPWNAWTFSADGRYAAGAFPWPLVGMIEIPNGEMILKRQGCAANIAPDDSRMFFCYVDGAHSTIGTFRPDGSVIGEMSLMGGEGMDRLPGAPASLPTQSWFPRWGNDKRFLSVAGPTLCLYMSGSEDIQLGRFNDDFTAIRQWIRVTNHPASESMAYVWVEQPDLR